MSFEKTSFSKSAILVGCVTQRNLPKATSMSYFSLMKAIWVGAIRKGISTSCCRCFPLKTFQMITEKSSLDEA